MQEMSIIQLIGSLGFPIVMCLLLFYQNQKEQEAHKEEINSLKAVLQENTNVLTALKEMLGGIRYYDQT